MGRRRCAATHNRVCLAGGNRLRRGRLRLSDDREDEMYTLKVKGMTCGHCAQTVTRALEAMPEVERALVDLDSGEVTVEGKADPMMLARAIAEAGYEVADA